MTVDVEVRERVAVRQDSSRLVALAAATAIVLILTLQRGHVHSFVSWFLAIPVGLAVIAVIRSMPETANHRVNRIAEWARGIDALWLVTPAAFAASFAVAQTAMSLPPGHSYWPIFWLWVAAIVATVAVIVRPSFDALLDWPRVRAWLVAHKWELLLVGGLTVAAFILRVVNLSSEPAPYSGDEAALANQGVHALEGETKNMFVSGLQGHATLQYFTQAIFFKVFGVSVFSSRLISVVAGTLTIPLFYLFLRQMFGVVVAGLGATYLVGYHFQLHFSRVALENIADALLMIAALYFVWRAARDGRLRDFAMAGLVMGIGLYLSPAGRVVPVIAAAFMAYCALRRPSFIRQAIPGMGMLALAYGVAALPVAIFWLTHQSQFMDRVNIVGIFQSGWIDREIEATGDSKVSILWDQAIHSFGAFGRFSDMSPHYYAPIPLVDRLSFVPFIVGLGYAIYRFVDERYMMLLMMFVAVVVTGGVLTMDPPTTQRLVGAIPPAVALIAIGTKLIAEMVSRWRPQASTAVAGVAVVALVTANVHFYFGPYRTGGYYSDYNTRVGAQVASYVEKLPRDTYVFFYGADRMFMSGGGHPAMTFPVREWTRFDVLLDGRVNAPVPEGEHPSVFIFLPHRNNDALPIIASCPGGEVVTYSTQAGRAGPTFQDAQVSFTAYELLTPNTCAPIPGAPES